MRIDLWELRKYKSKKDGAIVSIRAQLSPTSEPFSLTPEPPSPIQFEETQETEFITFPGGILIPKRPMNVSELLTKIPKHSRYTLEILVSKWQHDGEYKRTMISLLKDLDYHSELWRDSRHGFLCDRILKIVQS